MSNVGILGAGALFTTPHLNQQKNQRLVKGDLHVSTSVTAG